MKPSEKLMSTLLAELQRYPNFQVRRRKLVGLQDTCDAIQSGEALDAIRIKYGRRYNFTGKINTNSVELVRKAMNIDGPSRSSINRDPKLREYIMLREEERLNASQPSTIGKPQIDAVIRKLPAWEDQVLVINALHEGTEAKKELSLLKRQLSKIPKLALSIDDLKGATATESKNKPTISAELSRDIAILKALHSRLNDSEE